MVLQMVAWQDPQAIAIKAFYEPDLHVNFCGKLATDLVVQVTCSCASTLCFAWSSAVWNVLAVMTYGAMIRAHPRSAS